ncbi:hypothetical protein [Leptospira noumeaensis]|uniref:hypothetical protein n=1 Tax=Leptospira noumeaensis TaxID=2484964 RepID=UPI00142D8072|nr:hypothetical protein [Leptospira noumeaensis]
MRSVIGIIIFMLTLFCNPEQTKRNEVEIGLNILKFSNILKIIISFAGEFWFGGT